MAAGAGPSRDRQLKIQDGVAQIRDKGYCTRISKISVKRTVVLFVSVVSRRLNRNVTFEMAW